jgi:hypothetical protein
MAGGLEMVRVRVLFLEPGNKIHPSLLDDCLTDCMLADDGRREWAPEDYEEEGYLTLSKMDFADSIEQSHGGSILTSPNDPVLEMLKPLTVLYFDLLENNADWESGTGAIGFALENVSLWDEFGGMVEDFIAYAKLLSTCPGAHKSEYGTKVQFLTMWSCWSDQDHNGEWDCGEDFVGIFQHADIRTTKIKTAIENLKNRQPCPLLA